MKDFDAKIRERLNNHAADRPADAWDRFASKWPAQESANDPVFDHFVRDKLEHHQVHHARSTRQTLWLHLRQSLDLIRDRSREILLAKSMELALIFLVCLFWWPPQAPLPLPVQPFIPGEPMARLGSPEHELESWSTPETAHHSAVEPGPLNTGLARSSQPSTPIPPTTGSRTSQQTAASSSESLAPLAAASAQEGSVGTPDLGALDGLVESSLPWVEAEHSAPSIMDRLPIVTAPLLVGPSADVLVTEELFRPRARFHHRVSMAVHAEMHAIMTPYDHLLVKRGYDQWAASYGVAMGYSWEGRRWALRMQGTYRHLYYLPKPYTEVFDGDLQRGYFTESIRNIELNLVSLGLQVTRHLATSGHWRWYALTGGTMHMAVLANYDRKKQHLPGIDPVPPGEIPEPHHPSRTSQKRFADGFFEGGSLEENYYISLDVGAGVERHLTGRISLFAEPVYHHNPFQKSLGPNRDRISTLSLFTGIRVLL